MKKGFTLIELLAVIVILAIVALIAVPRMMNVIETARKGAAQTSALGYVDAVEKQIMINDMDGEENISDGTYSIPLDEKYRVKVKGKKPTRGIIEVEKGEVVKARICINNKSVNYENNEAEVVNNDYCRSEYNIVLNIDGVEQTKQLNNSTSTTFEINPMGKTNISCNNGSIPSIEGTILKVDNILGETKCYLNSSIEDTINNLDNSETNTVMLNDETLTNSLSIREGKVVNLDLNGKTISSVEDIVAILVYGKLNVDGSVSNSKVVGGRYAIIVPRSGKLKVKNGTYMNVDSARSSISFSSGDASSTKDSLIELDGDLYDEVAKTGLLVKSDVGSSIMLQGSGTLKIYNGTFVSVKSTISTTTTYDGESYIYGGLFTNESNVVVWNGSSGTININGGVFISEANSTIKNVSTGMININQTDKPIYITSLAQTWKPAINNASIGTINITANQANACTNNSEDTTSGLCVYAEGDGTINQTGNTAIATGTNCTGNINIYGGTYFGGFVAIINPGYQSGTINIKNAKLLSTNVGVISNRTSTTNICNSSIEAVNNDLVANQTATINYDLNSIFTDGTNTPTKTGTGTIKENYTGTCTE